MNKGQHDHAFEPEVKYTYADGRTETVAQVAGTVRSRDPEMMSVTNAGANDFVILVVADKRDLPARH